MEFNVLFAFKRCFVVYMRLQMYVKNLNKVFVINIMCDGT